ncbi:putative membrane protein [Bacillus clarus]|uniref:Putative membrane protein n=1 Tax=Bacillus clarus TaxID=2338372 RepID=A0A090YAK6_9BACI|nr:putative membrane protein [Bacillus clarus]
MSKFIVTMLGATVIWVVSYWGKIDIKLQD